MPRLRVYTDAAAKQRAYRERIKALRQAAQGPSNAVLAAAVRDLHIRIEYAASESPQGIASALIGKDALETFRNVVARLSVIDPL